MGQRIRVSEAKHIISELLEPKAAAQDDQESTDGSNSTTSHQEVVTYAMEFVGANKCRPQCVKRKVKKSLGNKRKAAARGGQKTTENLENKRKAAAPGGQKTKSQKASKLLPKRTCGSSSRLKKLTKPKAKSRPTKKNPSCLQDKEQNPQNVQDPSNLSEF